jgi:hypothetical protein
VHFIERQQTGNAFGEIKRTSNKQQETNNKMPKESMGDKHLPMESTMLIFTTMTCFSKFSKTSTHIL